MGLADVDGDGEKKVYYSPGRDGKTTCVENFFEKIHGNRPRVSKGALQLR